MNLIDLILKFVMNQHSGLVNPAEIGSQILIQIQKVLKSLIVLFIGSVIFCILMGYLIDRTLNHLDQGLFYLTPSIFFLLTLIIINLSVIFWALKKATVTEVKSKKEERKSSPSSDSPIETAIAALIFDFIKERDHKRKNSEIQQPKDNSQDL